MMAGTDTPRLCDTMPALLDFVGSSLPPRRLKHSESVAALAARFCANWGIDPARGELAGYAHDMCRAKGDEELMAIARRDGAPVDGLCLAKPRLLHARAAAVLLRERFGVADEGVLEAVRCHTFGEAGMGDLAKIVYCADKVEPLRAHVDPAFRESLLRGTIDEMMLRVVEDGVRWLESEGRPVAGPTLALAGALSRALGRKGADGL